MRFHRGTWILELRALRAWGKKLLSNLTERALILRYLLMAGAGRDCGRDGRVALQFPYQTVMQLVSTLSMVEDGWRETCPFQPAEKVEVLLILLVECRDVGGPGEILCNVHPQKCSAADSLYELSVVSGEWSTKFLQKSITTSFFVLH